MGRKLAVTLRQGHKNKPTESWNWSSRIQETGTGDKKWIQKEKLAGKESKKETKVTHRRSQKSNWPIEEKSTMTERSQNVSEAISEVEQRARTANAVESGEGNRREVDNPLSGFPGTGTLRAEVEINCQEQVGTNFPVHRNQIRQFSLMAASSTRDVRTAWVFSGKFLKLVLGAI